MIKNICECPNCGEKINIKNLLENKERLKILNLTEKRIWMLKEIKENDGITTTKIINRSENDSIFKITRCSWHENLKSLENEGYIKIIKAKSRSYKPKPYENYLYITKEGLKHV